MYLRRDRVRKLLLLPLKDGTSETGELALYGGNLLVLPYSAT